MRSSLRSYRAPSPAGRSPPGPSRPGRLAFRPPAEALDVRAVDALGVEPGMVLVDGNALPKWRHPARAIVSGDALSRSIAAASIIAKVTRDRMMQEYDGQYPGYGWRQNKGYGTAEHRAALIELGPTPLHRRSFAPVAQLCLAL